MTKSYSSQLFAMILCAFSGCSFSAEITDHDVDLCTYFKSLAEENQIEKSVIGEVHSSEPESGENDPKNTPPWEQEDESGASANAKVVVYKNRKYVLTEHGYPLAIFNLEKPYVKHCQFQVIDHRPVESQPRTWRVTSGNDRDCPRLLDLGKHPVQINEVRYGYKDGDPVTQIDINNDGKLELVVMNGESKRYHDYRYPQIVDVENKRFADNELNKLFAKYFTEDVYAKRGVKS